MQRLRVGQTCEHITAATETEEGYRETGSVPQL